MMKIKKFILSIAFLCIVGLAIMGCNNSSEPKEPKEQAQILIPESPCHELRGCETLDLDISNRHKGYVTVRYKGTNHKVKLTIKNEEKSTIYTLRNDRYGEFEAFPLNAGDGNYEISFFENIEGTSYHAIYKDQIDVSLEHPYLPFMYASQQVNFTDDDLVAQYALELWERAETKKDAIEKIYCFVHDTLDYDLDQVETVETGYISDVNTILEQRKGICIDYAAAMTALLRASGIPAKLVIGDVIVEGKRFRHAWVSAHVGEGELPKYAFRPDDSMDGWAEFDPTNSRHLFWGMKWMPKNVEYIAETVY